MICKTVQDVLERNLIDARVSPLRAPLGCPGARQPFWPFGPSHADGGGSTGDAFIQPSLTSTS